MNLETISFNKFREASFYKFLLGILLILIFSLSFISFANAFVGINAKNPGKKLWSVINIMFVIENAELIFCLRLFVIIKLSLGQAIHFTIVNWIIHSCKFFVKILW